ncbi:MAG: chemotaxis protein CheW [Desulfohalobiaceae bacterium]
MNPEESSKQEGKSGMIQLSCFYINNVLCGVDINSVQEINKNLDLTTVPLAQDYVLGIKNLRGQIVTVLDPGLKLKLRPAQITNRSRVIIIRWKEEYVGLMVDSITDVLSAQISEIVPPPSNIKGAKGRFFQGVYKTDQELVGILDIDALCAVSS